MIKPTVKQITSDSAISGPQFSFSEYAVNTVYHNDGQKIDFVTDGEDLYVFAVRNDENEPTTKPTLKEEAELGRFIKLVSKGATGKDGAPGKQGPAGEVPRISARFDGKQLILKSGTETIAVTGDLTGPAWKPEKQGDQIVWMETKDRTKPEPIDLSDLREKERPLLLRVDSDNTKRSDEISGPANMIQWKYEGDEHWTNLIAIDDLLNIALAGVCTWKSEEDGNWHIGHKEVVKATYDSNKDGKRIISQVELGDVLFDAGPIAKDMQLDIDTLEARLNEIEEILRGIDIPTIPTKVSAFENDVPYLTDSDLDGYATEDWVNAQGFLKDVPEVDAYTKAQSDAKFQPKGNYVKSVNDHTPDANGNVTVTLGDFDLTAYVKKSDLATINGAVLYNGGNIDISGGTTVIGLQDVEVSVSNGKLRYRKKENGTWGSYTNIMDVPASTGDGDTVNGFVNVSLSGNVLTFTRQDGTTKDIALPSSGDGQGCEYCWTAETINELITSALQGYSKVTVNPRLNEGTKIATITVNGSSFDLYAPNGDGTTPTPVPGEDAISLELTNEMDTIPVDKSNKTSSTASFLTELHAFGGNSEIGFTQDDVTVTITPNISGISVVKNIDNNPKKFQINVNSGITVENQVKITFTLWANDDSKSTRTINYNLVPLRLSQSEMFYLEINPDIVKVDADDNYSSETVSALPHWLLDGDPQNIVGWNDASKVNDPSVKYHVYYKLDNGEYIFYTDAVDITSVENVIAFELRYYYNNNKVDYVVMDREHVPIVKDGKNGQDGQDGDAVTILSQVRYYKASNEPTGVVAPNSSLDPTLPENGSWLTSSNSIVLDATNAYLWMFERIIYSNDRIWQSDPVVIRFFNDQVEVDYDTLAAEVESRISDDLNAAKQRITDAENRLNNLDDEIDGITTTTDDLTGRVTAVEARAVYSDEDIRALAELEINAQKASIIEEADAHTDGKINVVNQTLNALDGRITSTADSLDEVSGELNTVKANLDAAEANIELAATKSELNGAISDARTEWSAADAAITSTVYTKSETDTMMSAIQQKADKISILVGEDGDVKADVIVDAINGGEVTIEANKINLLGETIATAIEAATISADQIHGGTIDANCIDANSLHVDVANVDGLLEAGQIKTELINADEIHATVAEFEYLTVGGVAVGENNRLNIKFGNVSTTTTDEENTIYFLY